MAYDAESKEGLGDSPLSAEADTSFTDEAPAPEESPELPAVTPSPSEEPVPPSEETAPALAAVAEVPSVAAAEPLSISVMCTSPTICCGTPITFSMTASGGSGQYKYYVGGVMTTINNELYYDCEIRGAAYTENNTFTYTFAASGNYTFDAYVMDMSSYAYVRKRLEFPVYDPNYPSVTEKVSAIVADCESRGFSTEYEKALFYHDWLINNSSYDYSFSYAGPGGVLCRGTGTCESYHRALTMLLNRSGIVCERAEGGGHVWSCVKLDGEWTLIDATWDADSSGMYSHLNFGLTDEMVSRTHTGHTPAASRPCTSYERNYFIRSGEITAFSDPIKQQIDQRIAAGETDFSVGCVNHIDPSVYRIIYPCTGYYLNTYTYPGECVTVEYAYNESDFKSSVYRVKVKPHVEATDPAVPAGCETSGLTQGSHCSSCGTVFVPQNTIPATGHSVVNDPAVAPSGTTPGKTAGSHCSVCSAVLTSPTLLPAETTLALDGTGINPDQLWVDGVLSSGLTRITVDGKTYVDLGRTDASCITVYSYNSAAADVHQIYPVSMSVWMLSRSAGGYSATRITEFDNLLQYCGSSIRITGVKGIRMLTGVNQDLKSRLIGSGVSGYTLEEYGTVLAWASDASSGNLTLESPGAKSNFAYKRGVSDPVFAVSGGNVQYTNVLVGFNDDQCIPDIVMRPYMKLTHSSGQTVTVYGGSVERSIAYIAYQNRNVFSPGSSSYEYVWGIIHHVYGSRFDSEYK